MTTVTSPTITEPRYAKLKSKLRELFELDKADLDFGIYRIMAAKNSEVTDFLDRQLKDKVRETLTAHGSGELDKIKTELNEALEQAQALGADPDSLPKVQELRARLEAAGGKTGEQLEADIYNHLLEFFKRYYDDGDFISQRRYKGDTYAIPYSGEEVTLHWANKDQYYIKSGEWHKDYRFKLPAQKSKPAKRVQFALVDATQETNNNKEADESKRRYILVEDNPISVDGDTLTLRFQFKAPTEAEKNRADGEGAEQPPVAIFGGKYAKSTKGDERERFCADAEQRAIPHIPADWAKAVLGKAATDAKPNRTLLGKHLDAFTARNTFDYFIHKDLGEFLSRELDFYIKNEVVRLDDLDKAPIDHLQRIQGRVKAIRAVASSIIDLLASIENFQKKLWLKKKFVLNTNWLVTIDRIPESLRDVVAENQSQWEEWEKLGFKPKDDEIDGLFEGAKWGTRAYLDACDKLVVDTRLFKDAFTAEVLASKDETHLAGAATVDEAITGVLANSENSQALRLVQKSLEKRVDCIYIDPPYNTVHSKIAYKNQFEHGSWLSLIANPFDLLPSLWSNVFSFGVAIDDYEHARIAMLLRSAFPQLEHSTVVVNHHPQGSGGRLSRTHEYYILMAPPSAPNYLGRPVEGDVEERSFQRSGSAENNWRRGRPNSFYALIYDDDAKKFVGIEPPPERDAPYPREDTPDGYKRIYPISVQTDGKIDERVWRSSWKTGAKRVENNEIFMTPRGAVKQRIEHDMSRREVLFSNWTGSDFNAGTNGTAELERLGLSGIFDYPKSVKTLEQGLWMQSYGSESYIALDYFGGSGTTAHAAINVMREYESDVTIQFHMVEMGEYFWTILHPRVQKAIYSSNWSDGQAQTHNQGLSALVKCFAVESYEDALNNLPAPTGGMFDGQSPDQQDALLKYALDLEMGPSLLDLDIFRDPWGQTINAQLAGDDEIKRHKVDLVETFNYLLGLRVSAYGPIERYNAEFERSEHKDDLGRLKLKGLLNRDPNGPFKFHHVEGILNDEGNTRVLVVWRMLSDDPEMDSAVLDAWMALHRQEITERTEHRDYHQIYINGPVTLPQPTQEIRTIYPIEEAFKQKMFEDTDGVS